MADNDPSRWSHSTEEARDYQSRIDALNFGYDGVPQEASAAIPIGNPAAVAQIVSSGDQAKTKRAKARQQREAVEAKKAAEAAEAKKAAEKEGEEGSGGAEGSGEDTREAREERQRG
jgi:ABC-type Mn2+/Zn2+ transport system ATPase subunit